MVVMGMMGGAALMQLVAAIYIMLPVGTTIFMVMIDLVSIKTEGRDKAKEKDAWQEFSDVTVNAVGGEETLFARLVKDDQSAGVRRFLRDPLKAFTSKPIRILFLTVPIGIGYMGFMISQITWIGNLEAYLGAIDDHIVIGALIILVADATFYEVWRRRLSGIEASIPEFLDRMAGINQVGLTVGQALGIMQAANLGVLSHEIKRINRDMEWGSSFSEALLHFGDRVSTPIIARMVVLITRASEFSAMINQVLNIAASDTRMSEVLKRERLGGDVHLRRDHLPLVPGLHLRDRDPECTVPERACQDRHGRRGAGRRGLLRPWFHAARAAAGHALPRRPDHGLLLRPDCRADGRVLDQIGGQACVHHAPRRAHRVQHGRVTAAADLSARALAVPELRRPRRFPRYPYPGGGRTSATVIERCAA